MYVTAKRTAPKPGQDEDLRAATPAVIVTLCCHCLLQQGYDIRPLVALLVPESGGALCHKQAGNSAGWRRPSP